MGQRDDGMLPALERTGNLTSRVVKPVILTMIISVDPIS